jgi:hypothetical protein
MSSLGTRNKKPGDLKMGLEQVHLLGQIHNTRSKDGVGPLAMPRLLRRLLETQIFYGEN